MDARELNAGMEGTLAYRIENKNKNLQCGTVRTESAGEPWMAVKENWDSLECGTFFLMVEAGTISSAYVQKITDSLGSAVIQGYSGIWLCTNLNGVWKRCKMQADGAAEF